MEKPRLRIGVMGCSSFAGRALLPAMLECGAVELKAVSSRTTEKANQFAGRFHCEAVVGYDALLERADIDAVYMPLPTGLHEEWVLKTLAAGKHILVEKSAAETVESAEKMIALARAKNLLVMENFQFRHHSQHQWVLNLLARGELGEIQLFRSTFGFPPLAADNFRYQADLGGGALLDTGAYGVKAATLFLGRDLQLVGAAMKFDPASGVDIYGDAMLRSPSGQVAQLSWGFNYYYQCLYEILGTKGKLIVTRSYTPPPGFRPTVIVEHQDTRQEYSLPPDNHYLKMVQFFADTVQNQTDFTPYWDELLTQTRFLEQIRKESTR